MFIFSLEIKKKCVNVSRRISILSVVVVVVPQEARADCALKGSRKRVDLMIDKNRESDKYGTLLEPMS